MNVTDYKHIVWDWNGTLFDDVWLCRDIINGMLQARSLPTLSHERYQEIFDFPVIEYYRRVGFDFEAESFEKLGTEFIETYEIRRLEADLQCCARETVMAINLLGIPQSVLSAYKQDTLEELVAHFGLRSAFVGLSGLTNHYAAGKAENGLRWIKSQALNPYDVLLIGDTIHDSEVAEEMGAKCVLLASGHHSRARLEGCDVPVFDSLQDLLDRFVRG